MSRRKITFLILLLFIQLGVIWPGFALFADIYPMILGLPLSFFWIIVMLLSAFFLLLWYYLSDPSHKQQAQSESSTQ
jgi:membrane protein implicated in regulation of membrane protease activity